MGGKFYASKVPPNDPGGHQKARHCERSEAISSVDLVAMRLLRAALQPSQ